MSTIAQEPRSRAGMTVSTPPKYQGKHKDLIAACLAYLEGYGVFAWKSNTGAAKIGNRFVRFGVKGVADIIGCMERGRFLAVECKIRSDKPSDEQKQFATAVVLRGGYSLVVYSVDELAMCLNNINELKE